MESLENPEETPTTSQTASAPSGEGVGVGQVDFQGLFSYHGPFDLHPGPVLVLGPNAEVLAANAAAESIARHLAHSVPAAISDALTAASAGRVAQVNPFLVNADGTPATHKVQVSRSSGQDATTAGPGTSAFDLILLPWTERSGVLVLGREVTVERSLRSALVDSRQRFKDLVEISSDLAWETDRDGCFTFVSAGGATGQRALGHLAEDMVGRHVSEFLLDHADDAESPLSSPAPVNDVQVWFARADGSAACLSVTAVPLRDSDGVWCGARGLCRDISEAQARDAELSAARAREQLLAYVLRNVRDETDPRDSISSILSILSRGFALDGLLLCRTERSHPNDSGDITEIARLGCLPSDELLEDGKARFREAGEPPEGATLIGMADGKLDFVATQHREETNGFLALYRAAPQRSWTNSDRSLFDEIALHLGATLSRLGRHEALKRLSDTDPLTGLMNRRAFMVGLERAGQRCHAEGKSSAVFFVDLDNFKTVNDRLGHQSGDTLLQDLAARLVALVREEDLVARLGGDEFAVLLQGLSGEQANRRAQDMEAIGRELIKTLEDPSIAFGLSIGIAMMEPHNPLDADTILAQADEAMYRAKTLRKTSGTPKGTTNGTNGGRSLTKGAA